MKNLFCALLLAMTFLICSCSNEQNTGKNVSKKLDRTAAENLFEKVIGDNYLDADYSYIARSNTGKLLIRNGYAKHPRSKYDYVKLTPKIMPYFIGIKPYKSDGSTMCIGKCDSAILMVGQIDSIHSTGITVKDENNKIVFFKLSITKNEIGNLLGVNNPLTLVVNFKLYDDGWRYDKILWKESNEEDLWVKKYLHGFLDEVEYLNKVLWNMHENKIYSDNYKELAKKLEKIGDYHALDTVAWVYKDNGEQDKAVKIYEEKILPAVKQTGDLNKIEEYEKYFNKIKQHKLSINEINKLLTDKITTYQVIKNGNKHGNIRVVFYHSNGEYGRVYKWWTTDDGYCFEYGDKGNKFCLKVYKKGEKYITVDGSGRELHEFIVKDSKTSTPVVVKPFHLPFLTGKEIKQLISGNTIYSTSLVNNKKYITSYNSNGTKEIVLGTWKITGKNLICRKKHNKSNSNCFKIITKGGQEYFEIDPKTNDIVASFYINSM